jgi:hypothetical protein
MIRDGGGPYDEADVDVSSWRLFRCCVETWREGVPNVCGIACEGKEVPEGCSFVGHVWVSLWYCGSSKGGPGKQINCVSRDKPCNLTSDGNNLKCNNLKSNAKNERHSSYLSSKSFHPCERRRR